VVTSLWIIAEKFEIRHTLKSLVLEYFKKTEQTIKIPHRVFDMMSWRHKYLLGFYLPQFFQNISKIEEIGFWHEYKHTYMLGLKDRYKIIRSAEGYDRVQIFKPQSVIHVRPDLLAPSKTNINFHVANAEESQQIHDVVELKIFAIPAKEGIGFWKCDYGKKWYSSNHCPCWSYTASDLDSTRVFCANCVSVHIV